MEADSKKAPETAGASASVFIIHIEESGMLAR